MPTAVSLMVILSLTGGMDAIVMYLLPIPYVLPTPSVLELLSYSCS